MPRTFSYWSVMEWSNAQIVHEAVDRSTETAVRERSGVTKVGYFGSYARRDWGGRDRGVGSDVDLLVVVHHSDVPFQQHPLAWEILTLPVPASRSV